jgi:hypothetical protein
MLPLAEAARSMPFELLLVAGYVATAAALGKVLHERRRHPASASSATELERVPGRNWRKFQQSPAAPRVAIGEVGRVVVPRDLEQALLDPVVEPGAAEDELADPVDERLAVDDREPLPVADEVDAEHAAGFVDAPVRRELDEVGGLLVLELVPAQEPEPDGGGGNALLEVEGAEREAVAEELDDEIVAGGVVGLGHEEEDIPAPTIGRRAARRIALWVLASSVTVLVVCLGVLRLPLQEAPVIALLTPVVLAIGGSVLALLSLRARERAERADTY